MANWIETCTELKLFEKYADTQVTIPLSEYLALAALAQLHALISSGDAAVGFAQLAETVEDRVKTEFPIEYDEFFLEHDVD